MFYINKEESSPTNVASVVYVTPPEKKDMNGRLEIVLIGY
jgi:hypothetical protein